MSQPTTIYVVDTDPNMRNAIDKVAIAMNVQVQFHDNAESFLKSYLRYSGGCVVSEFRLLGINGIAMQQAMVEQQRRLPIVFVTAFAETPLTVRAIKAGAVTVLEKPFSHQDLWDALHMALAVDQQIRRIDDQHSQIRRQLSRITPKEREVLNLMIAGKPNKQIATQLSVSVRTVEARRHQIFKKAGVESVAELVKIILQSGEFESAKSRST